MESTLVSARIPHAKKDIGVDLLESLGASTSELINSAFDYLIENKQLPTPKTSTPPTARSFTVFVEQGTLAVDWGSDAASLDYREMIREGKRADYESLA